MTVSLEEYLTADEELPEDDQGRETWKIDGDRTAEWALRKMAQADMELERIHALAEDEILRVRAWADAASKGPMRDREFFDGALANYMLGLMRQDPKLRTYKLPAGNIEARKLPDRVEVQPETFLAWWEENRDTEPDLVRVNLAPDKAAIKQRLSEIVDPEYTIPGVWVTEGQDRIAAKPAL